MCDISTCFFNCLFLRDRNCFGIAQYKKGVCISAISQIPFLLTFIKFFILKSDHIHTQKYFVSKYEIIR